MQAAEALLLWGHARDMHAHLLDLAARVSEADWLAEIPGLAFGSAHGALAHQLGTEVVWLARWHGENPTTILGPSDFPTLAALRARWRAHDEALAAYLATLDDTEANRVVHYADTAGNVHTSTISEQMLHVLLHASQFRGEAAARLTALGHSPGNLDYINWKRQHGGA